MVSMNDVLSFPTTTVSIAVKHPLHLSSVIRVLRRNTHSPLRHACMNKDLFLSLMVERQRSNPFQMILRDVSIRHFVHVSNIRMPVRHQCRTSSITDPPLWIKLMDDTFNHHSFMVTL